MKSVVCSSLSAGAVGDVRSASGHDEGSASKLAGTGCSGESTKIGVCEGQVCKDTNRKENLFPHRSFKKSENSRRDP